MSHRNLLHICQMFLWLWANINLKDFHVLHVLYDIYGRKCVNSYIKQCLQNRKLEVYSSVLYIFVCVCTDLVLVLSLPFQLLPFCNCCYCCWFCRSLSFTTIFILFVAMPEMKLKIIWSIYTDNSMQYKYTYISFSFSLCLPWSDRVSHLAHSFSYKYFHL